MLRCCVVVLCRCAGAGWTGIASRLAQGRIIEVISAVRKYEPGGAEWQIAVAEPALELRNVMDLVGKGWSPGLVSTFMGFWFW